jgi:hypothetical protein
MQTQSKSLIRPGTLAQVLQLVKSENEELRFCMAGFLDDFYTDTRVAGRRSRLVEDPGLSGTPELDALLGAVGEHLCRRWNLGAPPPWTDQPERFLSHPWFMGPERMKGFNLAESPSAYRRRMIFTEAEPLRRARMPRDGRWWAYETIRSGLTPTSQEVSSLQDAANASEQRRLPDLVPVPDDTFHYSREVGD